MGLEKEFWRWLSFWRKGRPAVRRSKMGLEMEAELDDMWGAGGWGAEKSMLGAGGGEEGSHSMRMSRGSWRATWKVLRVSIFA